MQCDHKQTFNEALEKSTAIFLAEAVEEKKSEIDTTHHGKSENWEVKLKVLKSWRSVDRDFIWVETSGKYLQCGKIESGRTYLVYADQGINSLFIHLNSRTMLVEDINASRDLQILGKSTVVLNEGGLPNHQIQTYSLAGLLIILICLIFFFSRRKRLKNATF